MKKVISLVLAVLLLCAMLPVGVLAADISAEEYENEAKWNLENEHFLAAATLYEKAAQVYEAAGETNHALNAYVSAGDAYVSAGKNGPAMNAYLTAGKYDKVKELFLSSSPEELSGDDYFTAVKALAEQGVPESELADVYKKMIDTYLADTLSGSDLSAVIDKLQKAGIMANYEPLYAGAAKAYFAESTSAETLGEKLVLCMKARDFALKQSDTGLIDEIQAALSALQEENEEFEIANVILEAAKKDSAALKQFVDDLDDILNDNFAEMFDDQISREMGFKMTPEYLFRCVNTLTLAGDLCRSEGLYWHTVYVYCVAVESSSVYLEAEGYEALRGLYDEITNSILAIVEDAVEYALDLGETNVAKMALETVIELCVEFTRDFDTALELAAVYDSYFPPEGEEDSMVNQIVEYKEYIERHENGNQNTASTLSEGNLAIITAVAGVAIGLIGGLIIGKKKKTQ